LDRAPSSTPRHAAACQLICGVSAIRNERSTLLGVVWSSDWLVNSNPRYSGRQVWNRQRKDQVLIHMGDVALAT
jgi:hypothetical protein